MQRNTLFILVGLLILIGGSVTSYLILSEHKSAPTPLPAGPDLRGTAIFTDGEYGFSIRYPETFQTDYTFGSFYHLPANWRVNALNEGTGTPIIALVGYRVQSTHSYPRYFDTEIRIGVSKDPKEVARCEQPAAEQAEQALPDVTFGKTVFKAFSFESAGMMQYLHGVSYRAVHNGVCVAIEQLQTGSSYRDDPKSVDDIPDATLTAKYDQLTNIVKTFSFVSP